MSLLVSRDGKLFLRVMKLDEHLFVCNNACT
jgi:hypothetical protein